MKNTLKNSLILCGLLLAASMSFGQTILAHTTLSSAVTTSAATTIPLTSTTGVTATNTVLFVADGNGEAMFVNSVNAAANTAGVTRGYQSLGKARPHLSGALVFIVPMSSGYPSAVNTIAPTGSCTRTSIPYLPVISLGAAGTGTVISDCVGGVWVNGLVTAQNATQFRLAFPDPGAVIYTSVNTTGTTLAATTMYCSEIDLPYNKLVTGLGVLNGTTVGTDNHLVALYDATGNLIANSAVAGVLAATASNYQNISFTTSYYLVGPAQYFGCLQTNGTTATVRMLVTQVQDQRLTKGVTSITFGTIPATITVPTTFTTAVGPYYTIF
jgi:hypothetical protein